MKDQKTIPVESMRKGSSSFGKKSRMAVGGADKTSVFFTLRGRLTTLFIVLALVPLIFLAVFSTWQTAQALTAAANRALTISANITAGKIDSFIQTSSYAIDDASRLSEFQIYLVKPVAERPLSIQEFLAKEALENLYSKTRVLNSNVEAYWLINPDGTIALSTATDDFSNLPPFLGLDVSDPYAFKLVMDAGAPFVSPVIVEDDGLSGKMYFAGRITNEYQEMIGLVVAQYNAKLLQAAVEEDNGLAGQDSFGILLDDNHIRLAQGNDPSLLYKSVVPLSSTMLGQLQNNHRLPSDGSVETSTNLSEFEAGLTKVTAEDPYFTALSVANEGEMYSGVVYGLDGRSWKVVYIVPQRVFLSPLLGQVLSAVAITAVVAALSLILGIFVTGRVTKPITQLISVAEKVTAGNLWAQALESRDEIGSLARAFNTMTSELRSTLESLERRVAERTSELAKASDQTKERANQLQTVAEVAHAIAAVQDADSLLSEVTKLISERFAFYHVGVFLLDKTREYAILRAANSEGGQRMLARGHRLKVGETGIVGYVSGKGVPRIALDVGKDATFFDNPDLPYTRSEMAVPLIVSNQTIGALDVQSMEQEAFDDTDIAVIAALADQVAIAIENARLFTETRNTLAELEHLHRQYIQQAWTQETDERKKQGYEYREGALVPVMESADPALWEAVQARPNEIFMMAHEDNASERELMAPINVRGELIGVLNLGNPDPLVGWSEEDINLVRAVSDQIGQALENARLLEETQRRAEREHLVAEITTKLRASNDPRVILQTAALELQQALRAKQTRYIVQPMDGAPEKAAEAPHAGNGHKPEEETLAVNKG